MLSSDLVGGEVDSSGLKCTTERGFCSFSSSEAWESFGWSSSHSNSVSMNGCLVVLLLSCLSCENLLVDCEDFLLDVGVNFCGVGSLCSSICGASICSVIYNTVFHCKKTQV